MGAEESVAGASQRAGRCKLWLERCVCLTCISMLMSCRSNQRSFLALSTGSRKYCCWASGAAAGTGPAPAAPAAACAASAPSPAAGACTACCSCCFNLRQRRVKGWLGGGGERGRPKGTRQLIPRLGRQASPFRRTSATTHSRQPRLCSACRATTSYCAQHLLNSTAGRGCSSGRLLQL